MPELTETSVVILIVVVALTNLAMLAALFLLAVRRKPPELDAARIMALQLVESYRAGMAYADGFPSQPQAPTTPLVQHEPYPGEEEDRGDVDEPVPVTLAGREP